MLFELAIKVKVWLGVTARYPVVALAQCYVYNRIAWFNICIPYLTIYRIFYIFMRNSVKRASKEMNHVVNANEYFEIDSHEMSKTHLQLSHTHTHTHTHSLEYIEYIHIAGTNIAFDIANCNCNWISNCSFGDVFVVTATRNATVIANSLAYQSATPPAPPSSLPG